MTKTENLGKKPAFLTIFICILLALALLFGIVFGVINIVKYSGALVYYGDTVISEGEMNYLSSYYKSRFMREIRLSDGVNPYDTPEFWQRKDKDGVSYGERLKAGFREYLCALLSAVALYDSSISFSGAEKEAHEAACLEVLEYTANGDERAFNAATVEYGFDYSDFKSANILLYKSERAKEALFGADGSKLILQSSLCEEYLETYARVDLIFIRLERKFVLDGEGNFTYDSDGEVITEPLTPDEIAEREAKIAEMEQLIAEGRFSPESFDYYQKGSDGDASMSDIGYYLNPNAETTEEFLSEFPEIVNAAYGMEIGEFRFVDCEAIGGKCLVYREEVVKGAYASTTNAFFSDFYPDAADYLFPKTLKDLMLEVKFKDSFDREKIISQKRNNQFIVKSFK
jgi:hypothetical protein